MPHIIFRTVLRRYEERSDAIFTQKWIVHCLLGAVIVNVFTVQHVQRLFGDVHFTLNMVYVLGSAHQNVYRINCVLPRYASRF